jgi:hypothetical protein
MCFIPWKGDTHELIIKLDSVTKAMKYAKVNFYTPCGRGLESPLRATGGGGLKNLIDSGNPYIGKIYSYKDKL